VTKRYRKRKGLKKASLFNPDPIATAVAQKLDRDLHTLNKLYMGDNAASQFFQSAQRGATLKKYVPNASDTTMLEKAAYESFLKTNTRMKAANAKVRDGMPLSIQSCKTDVERMLIRAQSLMGWILGPVMIDELFHKCRNSAGVSQGVSFKDTSPEAKFTFPISGTSEVISTFEEYLVFNGVLKDAIQDLNSKDLLGPRYEEVKGSRATTVDKTATKRRMIAIEPTLNMFFQQGLMRVMYDRLRQVGLDVGRLPLIHTRKAMEASITGTSATIDFSSASDSVGRELLRWLLPTRWFSYVDLFRCSSMEIDGESVELEMISTMGNAGTFPLETLVFYCLQVAAVMERTQTSSYQLLSTEEDRAMVSVFGDDCILPVADAPLFIKVAQSVGFIVNEEKSFYDSMAGFRESCGGDYFHGTDVRPMYLQAPTSAKKSALAPWLYTILNRTIRMYIRTFGHRNYLYDKELLTYLFSLFRENDLLVKVVPPYFPDDSGLRLGVDLDRLSQCYEIDFDRVYVGENGAKHFRFHRFNYRDKRPRSAYLAYALWLGQPTHDEPTLVFPRKERGGYLVAKSQSSCWTVGPIKNKV